MYSVQFTHAGKKETTTTDAKTEREARFVFTRSLAAADIHWDTFS